MRAPEPELRQLRASRGALRLLARLAHDQGDDGNIGGKLDRQRLAVPRFDHKILAVELIDRAADAGRRAVRRGLGKSGPTDRAMRAAIAILSALPFYSRRQQRLTRRWSKRDSNRWSRLGTSCCFWP